MNLRGYLWSIGLASVVALVSFLAILWFFTPQNADLLVFSLLLLSLFMALWGFFSLSGFYLRKRKHREKSAVSFLSISFREGALLSLLLVGFLLMRLTQVFYWWTALIFLIIIVAIEMACLNQEE